MATDAGLHVVIIENLLLFALTQAYLHLPAVSAASSLNNTQILNFSSLRIIRDGGRFSVGGAVSQVKLSDQIASGSQQDSKSSVLGHLLMGLEEYLMAWTERI